MGMPRGKRLLKRGQTYSDVYAGFIDCGGGMFRRPVEYRGRPVNQYFVEKLCSGCQQKHLQHKANAEKHHNSFCSPECKSIYVRANSVGNKIRKNRSNGQHVLVKVDSHPRMDRHRLVYEHILVAEEKLGRTVEPHERVHHINCVKDDNRPENLHVCKDDRAHFLIHGSLNRCVAELIERGALRFNAETETYEVTP